LAGEALEVVGRRIEEPETRPADAVAELIKHVEDAAFLSLSTLD
jgi:hypothetical protein